MNAGNCGSILTVCAGEYIFIPNVKQSKKKHTGFAHKNTASKMYYGLVGGYHPYKLCSHCEFRKSLGNLGQTCEIAIMNSSPGKRYMMASSEEIKRPDR